MNFIEKYDKILTKNQCERIIELYKLSPFKNVGLSGNKIDYSKKIGSDISLLFYPYSENTISQANQEINEIVFPSIVDCLEKYKRKYPLIDKLPSWNINNDYHVQYFGDNEGYFAIHCEQESITSKRMLVWMIYLNNAKCGTRFYHQKKDIYAKQGSVLLWPAAWSHMHSGITPNIGDKYIITGWFSYD
jgi:hypothetical protein